MTKTITAIPSPKLFSLGIHNTSKIFDFLLMLHWLLSPPLIPSLNKKHHFPLFSIGWIPLNSFPLGRTHHPYPICHLYIPPVSLLSISISIKEMLFLRFSISFVSGVSGKIEILICDEFAYEGILLSPPQHALQYQMQNDNSLKKRDLNWKSPFWSLADGELSAMGEHKSHSQTQKEGKESW